MLSTQSFRALLVLLVSFLYGTAAQHFVTPPDNGRSNTDIIYHRLETVPVAWDCDWETINLVLFNEFTDSNGNRAIFRILSNATNPGTYPFQLGDNLATDRSNQFHFSVLEVYPSTGQETGKSINSVKVTLQDSVTVTPSPQAVTPSTQTATQVIVLTNPGVTSLVTIMNSGANTITATDKMISSDSNTSPTTIFIVATGSDNSAGSTASKGGAQPAISALGWGVAGFAGLIGIMAL